MKSDWWPDLGPHEWLYIPCPHHWQWWPYGPQDYRGRQYCAGCGATRPGVIRVPAQVVTHGAR